MNLISKPSAGIKIRLALGRHKAIAQQLRDKIQFFPGMKAMEFGARNCIAEFYSSGFI